MSYTVGFGKPAASLLPISVKYQKVKRNFKDVLKMYEGSNTRGISRELGHCDHLQIFTDLNIL